MIDFSNMLGKPLAHCFVPADQQSITFVFEDGMRRSFGVEQGGMRLGGCSVSSPDPTEGVVFTSVDRVPNGTGFVTQRSVVLFSYPTGASLIELPE